MGNAALCSSCHAEKSVRAQEHMQELDKTPDYYGCNIEDTKEPRVRVSVRPQTQKREDGGLRIHSATHWSNLNFLEGS
jgi:hypothetical protein